MTKMIQPNRRDFIKAGVVSSVCLLPGVSSAIDIPRSTPFLNLREQFKTPIIIESIKQLQVGKSIWIEVRSKDGEVGFCPGNDRLKVTLEMAKQLVIPFFEGKDARDLESLVDDVYTVRDSRGSVYKFAGMPFWNIVGHVEVALFDMLGKIATKPISQIIGSPKRQMVDVYISQFGRETTAQLEVENAAKDLQETGSKAIKLKVGKRMSNSKKQRDRDRRMIELARETLGDGVTIYVDANSSYTIQEAIEMGRFLDEYHVELFEEPLPWQDYNGTREVTQALEDLEIQVAGGEQDSSLWQWEEIVEKKVVNIVQPDVFYNGGLIRSLRVAKMAEAAGMQVTPHSPKILPAAAANLHLCSVLSNPGPFQEYRSYGKVENGQVAVPTGPGLGITIDRKVIDQAPQL